MMPDTEVNAPPEEARVDVTGLLLRWRDGDPRAADELASQVYGELHQLAHSFMRRERVGDLLQTTALVNEAYIRLVGVDVEWECRSQFFGICARVMRRILLDAARRRLTDKRGGATPALRLGDYEIPASRADHLVALDDALQALGTIDPRKSQVLEFRYFGGMTAAEIAESLDISKRTVERDIRLARAWVADAMGKSS